MDRTGIEFNLSCVTLQIRNGSHCHHDIVHSRRLLGEPRSCHPRTVHARTPAPHPATEFVHESTVRAPIELDILIERKIEARQRHTRRWTVAQRHCLNAECRREVVGWHNEHYGDRRACLNARDVMTAVLGTSTSRRLSVVLIELMKMYASAESQGSSDQPQALNFRTILLKVDVLACVLLGASLFLTADVVLLGFSLQ